MCCLPLQNIDRQEMFSVSMSPRGSKPPKKEQQMQKQRLIASITLKTGTWQSYSIAVQICTQCTAAQHMKNSMRMESQCPFYSNLPLTQHNGPVLDYHYQAMRHAEGKRDVLRSQHAHRTLGLATLKGPNRGRGSLGGGGGRRGN